MAQFIFISFFLNKKTLIRLLRSIENETSFSEVFQNGDEIERGAFGVIYKVVNRASGKPVAAIKWVNLRNPRGTLLEQQTIQESK